MDAIHVVSLLLLLAALGWSLSVPWRYRRWRFALIPFGLALLATCQILLLTGYHRPADSAAFAAAESAVLLLLGGTIVTAVVSLDRLHRERQGVDEELHRALNNFRASEALNREIINAMPGGIVHVSMSGGILLANGEAQRILGLSYNAMSKMYVNDWDSTTLHEDGTPCPATEYPVVRCLSDGHAQPPMTLGVRRPDGTVSWAIYTAIPVFDAQSKAQSGAMVTFMDITARRRMEEALQVSEQRYRTLAENSAVGIWHIDPAGETIYANPAMCALLEVENPAALRGISYQNFFTLESVARIKDHHAHRRAGTVSTYEVELLGRHGARRNVMVAGAPIAASDGALVSMIGTFTDVTERRRADAALRESERALRKAEERLRTVVNDAPIIFFAIDAEGIFTLSEGLGLKRLGRKPGQVVGQSVFEMYRDSEEILASIRRALDGEAFTAINRAGDRIYETHYTCVRDENGFVAGATGVATDITDRVHAENALRNRMEFEALLTQISAAFIQLSPDQIDGGISRALAQIGEFTGADRSYVFQFSDGVLTTSNTHEWHADGILAQIQNLQNRRMSDFPWLAPKILGLQTFHVPSVAAMPPEAAAEQRELTKLGVRSVVAVPLAAGAKLVGFLGLSCVRGEKSLPEEIINLLRIVGEIFVYALERKRADEALRESESRFRGLSEATTDGIVIHEGGVILDANKGIARMFGYEQDELLQRKVMDFIPPEDHAMVIAVMRSGSEAPYESQGLRKDGSRFPVEVVVKLHTYRGRPVRVAAMRDITERRRAEREKRALEHKLLETQRLESLGVLAGGIAHDFNNLLAAILGNVSMGSMQLPQHSLARPYLANIETTTHRAAELCRQMLAFSGKGRFVVQPVAMNAIIEELSQILRVSVGRHIAFRLELARSMPPIVADATQIRQVVMNLIINASEAIGDQGGVIALITGSMRADRDVFAQTHLSPDLPDGEYAFLEVSDTGVGMDDATKARIFDPFFSTKFTGRGLGLAAVLGIVRGHHGAIKVESELGRGTTFRILFPAQDATRAETPAAPALAETQWRGSGAVVIVESDETLRSLQAGMVESFGFSAVTAANGPEGLRALKDHRANVAAVLLDLAMPGRSGQETLRDMRAIRPDVPVILMSGYNPSASPADDLGAADYLQKPFSSDELGQRLRNVTKKPAAGSSALPA